MLNNSQKSIEVSHLQEIHDEELKQSVEQLNIASIKNLTQAQFKEMENVQNILINVEQTEEGNDDDEDMLEGGGGLDEGKEGKLSERAAIFKKLIVQINQNTTAATAILTYNQYASIHCKESSQNNDRNDNHNARDEVADQLNTFSTVYDMLWKIHGDPELWPFFRDLFKNSVYLKPFFWNQCGYPVGFAISDLIKMIIINSIWLDNVDSAMLKKYIRQSVENINTKIKGKKSAASLAKYQLLKEDEISALYPDDPKV